MYENDPEFQRIAKELTEYLKCIFQEDHSIELDNHLNLLVEELYDKFPPGEGKFWLQDYKTCVPYIVDDC